MRLGLHNVYLCRLSRILLQIMHLGCKGRHQYKKTFQFGHCPKLWKNLPLEEYLSLVSGERLLQKMFNARTCAVQSEVPAQKNAFFPDIPI